MEYDLTSCQITSGMVNTVAAIAESIGQLEGVNLIQPGPQRNNNKSLINEKGLAGFYRN
jgi:hypothetical protein